MNVETNPRMVNQQASFCCDNRRDFATENIENHIRKMTAKIPSLLLINEDVINPMKVLFETTGHIVSKKNEDLKKENSKDVLTNNVECSKEKPNHQP